MPQFGSAVVEATSDGIVLGTGGMGWDDARHLLSWLQDTVPAPRSSDQWCPVCHTHHQSPGAKTDYGALLRPCPLLAEDDPANQYTVQVAP